MPKVSIVLPTYNGEDYLRESIESVIAQSFTDWELIIVNDCSTDSTPQIADEYAAKDCRIRVIHNQTNQKLPNSLNIGFESASGDYLTWTSDDNIFHHEALIKMHDFLLHNDYCMVCARMRYIDNNGHVLSLIPEDFCSDSFYYTNNVRACFMYKRCVLDSIGPYDSDLFCVEDYDYWMRIMNHYKKIGFIPEILYYYRMHNNSLSSTHYAKVRKQLAKMRNKYDAEIVAALKNTPSYLWQIYLDFIENKKLCEPLSDKYIAELPEIKYDSFLEENKEIVIFGSGQWGQKVLHILNGKACFFVDNDVQKIGQKIENIEVISFEKLKSISQESDILIVIAVQNKWSYDIVHQLYRNHIYNYCSLPLFINSVKNETE